MISRGTFRQNLLRKCNQNRVCLSMHMGHSHTHDHDCDDVEHSPVRKLPNRPDMSLSLWGQLLRPEQTFLRHPLGKVVLAALIVGLPALLIRKTFVALDFWAFAGVATILTGFDAMKSATKNWMKKIQTFQEGVVKHSTPMTKKYFFKNENAADRVTLVGIFVNILLSVGKFVGGIGKFSLIMLIII